MCNQRVDIEEYSLLEEKINIEDISYNNIILLCKKFVKKIITEDTYLDNKLKATILDSIEITYKSKSKVIEINQTQRKKIWELHDSIKENNGNKKLARLSVCCFYDESFSIENPGQYNSEEVLGLFYELLCDLNNDFGKQFTGFLLNEIKRL